MRSANEADKDVAKELREEYKLQKCSYWAFFISECSEKTFNDKRVCALEQMEDNCRDLDDDLFDEYKEMMNENIDNENMGDGLGEFMWRWLKDIASSILRKIFQGLS
jgi:hypothetical protein